MLAPMAEALSSQGKQRRYLVVRTGGVSCAIPALSVCRVTRGLPICPVPGGARRLLGLSHHDGDPIAVLDLAEMLGLGLGAGSAQAGVTVVVRVGASGGGLVGLGVDEALAVATPDSDGPRPTAADTTTDEMVALGGELLRVVDLERLGAVPAVPAPPGATSSNGSGA